MRGTIRFNVVAPISAIKARVVRRELALAELLDVLPSILVSYSASRLNAS
jgi:hypothetical protein